MMKLLFGTLVLMATLDAATADENQSREVSVTASVGRSVIIDQGSSGGLEIGQRVRFYPPGTNEIEGYVQNVSVDSARVEFPPNTPLPPVGSRGEVEVSAESEEIEGDKKSTDGSTEHPPWTRKLDVHNPDDPLLSPVYGMRDKDRPPTWNGRVFTQFNGTFDRGDGRESDFYLGRFGISGTAKNLFHDGGRLQFAGEGDFRGSRIADGEDDSEIEGRLDRLSYALGGQQYSPYRAELGRFYSQYIPEFGLIDGVEGALRFNHGITAGIGGGALPIPYPGMQTGDDLGIHTFVQYQSESEHALSALFAYQKTWHQGEADRDLVFARLNVRPTDSLRLYGSVKADLYLSGESIETKTAEITQAWFHAQFTPDSKKGASFTFSHYSWPELLREEYRGLSEDLVADGHVDRGSLSGWFKPMDNLRLSARGNVWMDNDDLGGGGEIGADILDIKGHGTSIYSALSYSSGSFNDGLGGRIEARQRWKAIDVFAGYQVFSYKQQDLISGSVDSMRQSIRTGLNWSHGDWYQSISGDYFFGDGENAVGISFYTEWRF